jgi:sodium-dependent dicarboxylate transporter 2/3/5
MSQEKTTIGTYKHYIIALAICLVTRFALQPVNGLTEQGVLLIAFILPTLYLWIAVNTHWVSVLFIGAVVMTQIMTPVVVYQNALGHFVVITLLAYMLLTACLHEAGVIDKVASWFITRKFVQGRPYAFMGMFFASNLILGIFMNNLALCVIYIRITAAVCEKIGVKKGESFYKTLMLGTMWGSAILSVASPIANALPVMMIGFLAGIGIQITFAQWFLVGMPFMVLMFIVSMICARIAKPDSTAFKNFDINEFKKTENPLTAQGKIASIVMLIVTAWLLLPDTFLAIGILTTFSRYMVDIGVVVPAILAVAALCIIHVGGKPVMDFPRAATQVPVTMLVFLAGVTVMVPPMMAAGPAAEATGIAIWMQNLLSPLVSGMTPLAIAIVLVIIGLILSQVVTAIPTMVIFWALGTVLLLDTGMSLLAYGICVTYLCSLAVITPAGSINTAFYYTGGHYTVKEVLKPNIVFIVLSAVVLIAYVIPFASAIF